MLRDAINGIVKWFEFRGPAFREPAMTWKASMIDRLGEALYAKPGPSLEPRVALVELIVVAERLRNWECLVGRSF